MATALRNYLPATFSRTSSSFSFINVGLDSRIFAVLACIRIRVSHA